MSAWRWSAPANCTFRLATLADARGAADVYIRARHHAVPAIPPMVHSDDDVRRHWAEAVVPNDEVWVAEVEGEIVGVLALEDDWVDQLYLAPGWTAQGIGTALLGIAKERRPDSLRLWAFQSNVDALRFYERHGFVEVDRTDGDNEERAPDVLYAWKPRSA
jgi:GNAT superfamily N-acetyltransferase